VLHIAQDFKSESVPGSKHVTSPQATTLASLHGVCRTAAASCWLANATQGAEKVSGVLCWTEEIVILDYNV
jgi:hypothetical protein